MGSWDAYEFALLRKFFDCPAGDEVSVYDCCDCYDNEIFVIHMKVLYSAMYRQLVRTFACYDCYDVKDSMLNSESTVEGQCASPQ